jgi:hypothetical protein
MATNLVSEIVEPAPMDGKIPGYWSPTNPNHPPIDFATQEEGSVVAQAIHTLSNDNFVAQSSARQARSFAVQAESSARAALGWATIALHRLNHEKKLDEAALTVLSDVGKAMLYEAERIAELGDKLKQAMNP